MVELYSVPLTKEVFEEVFERCSLNSKFKRPRKKSEIDYEFSTPELITLEPFEPDFLVGVRRDDRVDTFFDTFKLLSDETGLSFSVFTPEFAFSGGLDIWGVRYCEFTAVTEAGRPNLSDGLQVCGVADNVQISEDFEQFQLHGIGDIRHTSRREVGTKQGLYAQVRSLVVGELLNVVTVFNLDAEIFGEVLGSLPALFPNGGQSGWDLNVAPERYEMKYADWNQLVKGPFVYSFTGVNLPDTMDFRSLLEKYDELNLPLFSVKDRSFGEVTVSLFWSEGQRHMLVHGRDCHDLGALQTVVIETIGAELFEGD